MINRIRRWFGLCIHSYHIGSNIMTSRGVVHLQACTKCGKVRWVKGYRQCL